MSTNLDPSIATPVAGYKPITIDDHYIVYVADDADEDLACEVIRKVKAIALGREKMIARIKECIEQLAKIDDERGGDETGLVELSDVIGWTASRDESAQRYQRVLTAIVETEEDVDRLALALDCAEDCLACALRAEVQ